MKLFKKDKDNKDLRILGMIKKTVSEIHKELKFKRQSNKKLGFYTDRLFFNIESACTVKEILVLLSPFDEKILNIKSKILDSIIGLLEKGGNTEVYELAEKYINKLDEVVDTDSNSDIKWEDADRHQARIEDRLVNISSKF